MSEKGYFKISDIVRTAGSGTETILPISRSTWLRGIERGLFPQPVKLLGINLWSKDEVMEVLQRIDDGLLESENDGNISSDRLR